MAPDGPRATPGRPRRPPARPPDGPRATPGRAPRDAGYALVLAVIAVAAFAYMAFQVLAQDQGATALAVARTRQARLAAAADAGVSLALHALAASDSAARWTPDGHPRHIDFAGFDLTITIEDERSKAPLDSLDDAQVRALFAAAGAEGQRLDALTAEFRDWRTPDPAGTADPSARALVRHGPFRTVGELAALPDMTPAIFARLAGAVTAFPDHDGQFDASHASPLAQTAMAGGPAAGGAPAIDAQRPTEDLATPEALAGHTLTIAVVARDRDGERTHRTEIVELTGDRARPFWTRYAE